MVASAKSAAAPALSPEQRREKLERSLHKDMMKAIKAFDLVEDGDRIMVGVSGGKDSYALLHLLELARRRAPVRYELVAVNLDQGHPGYPVERIEGWLKAEGYRYRILSHDTYSIVQEKVPAGKITCPLCSRLRRGILYNAAVEMGCNKIALGHHREDLIETLLLNLFYAGQIKTMPPRLHSDDGRNIVIRPLAYCAEAEIAEYAELMAFPIIPCNLCGSQENLQRQKVKALMDELSARNPAIRGNILRAMHSVVPSHLLDASLLGE